MTHKEKYYKYLRSAAWLIKKSELIEFYKKLNLAIECENCGSTDDLQVDHIVYDRIFRENMEDLQFLCKECHQHKHSQEFDEFTEKQWKFIQSRFDKNQSLMPRRKFEEIGKIKA